MAISPKYTISFARGLNTEGGPFLFQHNHFRNGKNTTHHISGKVENRLGLELLNESNRLLLSHKLDSTYLLSVGSHYCEVVNTNGTTTKALILVSGPKIYIYTSSFVDIDINAPDYEFTIQQVSPEANYYKAKFLQIGNAIIITLGRAPVCKLVWTTTFNLYYIQAIVYNSKLFDVPAMTAFSTSIPGWFCRELPLVTGTDAYQVLDVVLNAAPGFTAEVYVIAADGSSTRLLHTQYTYSELFTSSINLVTATLTLNSGIAATGSVVRIYLGLVELTSYDAELTEEQIKISNFEQNFGANNSYTPTFALAFAGRVFLGGIEGQVDITLSSSIEDYGNQFAALLVSELFPKTLENETNTILKCLQSQSPLDIDGNAVALSDGTLLKIDNAAKLLAASAYGPNIYVVATNGVWIITGTEDFFALDRIIIKKLIDDTCSSKSPIASTEHGVFVISDTDIYQINPSDQEGAVKKLVENNIYSLYNKLTLEQKQQSWIEYDKKYKRLLVFYPDTTDTSSSKYGREGASTHYLIYNIETQSWFSEQDISEGDWKILSFVSMPATNYFELTDTRYTLYKQLSVVVLGRRLGSYTEITLGIMEGKNYCADYFGTDFVAPFESYIETYNTFGEDMGLNESKTVAKMYVNMIRQETGDADADGYYEFPGSVYLWKRWKFADHEYAGPLYSSAYNTVGDVWEDNPKQIYFSNKYGSAVVGGGKPPFEVITAKLKVRGRGAVLSFKFGNKFGDTTLTGDIQEQWKGWGVFNYQINFISHDLGGQS